MVTNVPLCYASSSVGNNCEAEAAPLLVSSDVMGSQSSQVPVSDGPSCSHAALTYQPAALFGLPVEICGDAGGDASGRAAGDAASPSQPMFARCCRICMAEEGEDPELGPLFTPCLCRDPVHAECLRTWRATGPSSAFYSCNVCKWEYRFSRLSKLREAAIRLSVPLWPLLLVAALSSALGFIPMFGPADGNLGIHLLNGLAAVGLIYLCVIVAAFNWQYVRLTVLATRAAAAAAGVAVLPPRMRCQLLTTTVARCLMLAFFFSFCIVYFFPYSGFMGVMAMVLVSPPLMKELGDRLVRKLEFDRPILEVTREMATKDAADRATAAAEAAAAATAAAATATQVVESEQQVPLGTAPAPVEQQNHCIVSILGAEGAAGSPSAAHEGAHSAQHDDSQVPLLQNSAAEKGQRSEEQAAQQSGSKWVSPDRRSSG